MHLSDNGFPLKIGACVLYCAGGRNSQINIGLIAKAKEDRRNRQERWSIWCVSSRNFTVGGYSIKKNSMTYSPQYVIHNPLDFYPESYRDEVAELFEQIANEIAELERQRNG